MEGWKRLLVGHKRFRDRPLKKVNQKEKSTCESLRQKKKKKK